MRLGETERGERTHSTDQVDFCLPFALIKIYRKPITTPGEKKKMGEEKNEIFFSPLTTNLFLMVSNTYVCRAYRSCVGVLLRVNLAT